MKYEISTLDNIVPYMIKNGTIAIFTSIDLSRTKPLQGFLVVELGDKVFLDKTEWYTDGVFHTLREPTDLDIEGEYPNYARFYFLKQYIRLMLEKEFDSNSFDTKRKNILNTLEQAEKLISELRKQINDMY